MPSAPTDRLPQVETAELPPNFRDWFARRGWRPHRHQLAMLDAARRGQSALLVAPTGGGKTLAGFLPSLVALDRSPENGLHTLYVSPLKALTTDIARNLRAPIEEIGLAVRAETRTGDTPQNRRLRQRRAPPDILLTTPESLALLLSYPEAPAMFGGLATVIVDELHALAAAKRGQLLALGLARLGQLAPRARFVGLSATVREPAALLAYLAPGARPARLIEGAPGPAPEVAILVPDARLPWAGHYGTYAAPALYATIKAAGTTLVFVNTRAQAELLFRELWRHNDDLLPIALHHGSLAVEQRRRVEAAMVAGALKAIVCTSSLDLGIDWGAVDLVVQIGAPKGVARLLQRIGRANHRLDQPSRALLVPGNRFEVLECRAALDAIRERTLDGDPPHPGGLDVLAQHLVGTACCGPFDADRLYAEVRTAQPYAGLSRADFDAVLELVATGGYALGAYERFRRLKRGRRRALAAGRPAAHKALPDERRHDRRGADAAGPPQGPPPGAGRGRGRVRRAGCGRATSSSSPAARCASRAFARPSPRSASPRPAASRRCRATWARAWPSRPTSRPACAAIWPSPSAGRGCRTRSSAGCACRASARRCRARTSSWSRPSRAARATTW